MAVSAPCPKISWIPSSGKPSVTSWAMLLLQRFQPTEPERLGQQLDRPQVGERVGLQAAQLTRLTSL